MMARNFIPVFRYLPICLLLITSGGVPAHAADVSSTARGAAGLAEATARHWAFQTPRRPSLPAVTRAKWAQTPLDAFILARLDREHLEPTPEAGRVQLLRRAALDLTGLPPTPAEVDAFLADTAPNAYARVVERLLASPHYGERWGRHWLDAARYADSNGYEKDRAREMWHYRDWVVNALNTDEPYDRFLIEQIAGDLLPDPTQDQIIATGFLRNSMINEEGAIDPEQFRMEAMFDRMDCLGKAVLGLTIQCAQCHNHKYDPISQEEYYRLFAYLNDADELTAPVYGAAERERLEGVRRDIQRIEDRLRAEHPDWPERLSAWEAKVRGDVTEWSLPELVEYGDPGGLSKLELQKDQSLLAGGHRFSGGTWRIRARTTLTNVAAVRLEALANARIDTVFQLGPRHTEANSIESARLGQHDRLAQADAGSVALGTTGNHLLQERAIANRQRHWPNLLKRAGEGNDAEVGSWQ